MKPKIISLDELTIEVCNCCHDAKIEKITQLVYDDGYGYSLTVDTEKSLIHTFHFPSHLREEIEKVIYEW